MKEIICLSGGEASALVAIEAVRKYGKENVILLNHDISSNVEDADIKRFKKEISDYLGIPITYANINGITDPDLLPDQFDVCIEAGALTDFGTGNALCTSRLKTEPFYKFIKTNFPRYDTLFGEMKECRIHYGFSANETARIQRRSGILGGMNYKTVFLLAFWKGRTIFSVKEAGIDPPNTYSLFEHANCIGCLKAGLLHWYVTYVLRKDLYNKGIVMENKLYFTIHTIIRNKISLSISLQELEPIYKQMYLDGLVATEHQNKQKFANLLRTKYGLEDAKGIDKPCECTEEIITNQTALFK